MAVVCDLLKVAVEGFGFRLCYSFESVPSPNVLVGESIPIGILLEMVMGAVWCRGGYALSYFWRLRAWKDGDVVGGLGIACMT